MKWLRLWTDILDDPKMAVSVTPYETFHTFIMLMVYARELDNAGVIDQPDQVIAWRLRMEIPRLKSHLAHLKEINILTLKPQIKFLNWDKRQFTSDNSSERVKKFRIKNETLQKRYRNGSLCTESESDTDTEQKQIRSKPLRVPENGTRLSLAFESLWVLYPKHREKKTALGAFKDLSPTDELISQMKTAIENQVANKLRCARENIFCPEFKDFHRWLKKGCWQDEVKAPEDSAESIRKQMEDDYERTHPSR